MAIAKVQEVFSYTAAGGGTTKNVTIATPGAGNTLVLIVSTNSTATVSSVTGGGVTWTKLTTITGAVGAAEIWTGPNSSGAGTTVAVVVSNAYARFDASVTEWSGMPTTLTADGGSDASTTSPNITSPSVTPSATGQPVLLIAVAVVANTTISAGPTGGFTAISTTGGSGYGGYAYQIAAAASGSYQAGWTTVAGYGTRRAGIYGFDGTAGGGTKAPPAFRRPARWFKRGA